MLLFLLLVLALLLTHILFFILEFLSKFIKLIGLFSIFLFRPPLPLLLRAYVEDLIELANVIVIVGHVLER